VTRADCRIRSVCGVVAAPVATPEKDPYSIHRQQVKVSNLTLPDRREAPFLAEFRHYSLPRVALPQRGGKTQEWAYVCTDTGATVNHVRRVADTGMLVSLNRDHEIVNGSAAFFHTLGTSADELCGRRLYDLVVPGQREPLVHLLTQLSDGTTDRFMSQVTMSRRVASALPGLLAATALRSGRPGIGTVALFVRTAGEADSGGMDDARSLAEMDAKILEGVAAGLTSSVLASRLFVSRQTVEYHIGRLLKRFGVPSRSALIAYSYSVGILCVDTWPPQVLIEELSPTGFAQLRRALGVGCQ
jgi:DNA-binding CsgD family transcriptional regulator